MGMVTRSPLCGRLIAKSSPSKPEGENGYYREDCYRDPIKPICLEVMQQINFAAKTPRTHRHVHIAAELKRLRHQDSRACGCHSSHIGPVEPTNHPALSRLKHIVSGSEQEEDVAVCHARNHHGHERNP